MIRDALITFGFCMAIYLVARGTFATCGDLAGFCRTIVRARRP